MTAKWMRIEKVTLLDGVFAVIVAALLCLLLVEDQLPIPAFGADNSKSNLVAYFVTWHVITRGSHQRQSLPPKDATKVETWRTTSEMRGSAITRFVDRGGILSYWDTRFLIVEARKNTDYWETTDYCFSHNSHTIADTGSYSGYYNDQKRNGDAPSVLDGSVERRNGVITNFSLPFSTWRGMKFTEHFVIEEQGGTNCNVAKSWDQNGFPSIFPAPRDLPADRDNPNSYSLNTRASGFDTEGIPIEVHWTADAYLMGKCAERDGPIQEDDPIITDEQVDVDPEDPVITPDGDGKTNVKIRVTCDHVPIQNANVEVKLEVQNKSGYHNHEDDGRPLGKLDGKEFKKDSKLTLKTDDNGYAYAPSSQTRRVKFEPPIVGHADTSYGGYKFGIAGVYKVTAKSEKSKSHPESTGTTTITARVDGLSQMEPGAHYLVEGATKTHPEGFWGRSETLQEFRSLADDFQKYQELHSAALNSCGKTRWEVYPASINDIALHDGGVFDWRDTWKQPHQTHNRGEGGDFNRFGAGPKNNINALGPGKECDGSIVPITAWLIHVLIDLGWSYGHWDCSDMGIPNCNNGELPSSPWIPKKLHLHVQD